jgi:molybdopterin synthase catalytic subunit/molybdopterin converting factor small subunit
MRVRLLLFAGLREAVGRKEHALELADGGTLAEVIAAAERELPEVARYQGRLLVSLNEEPVSLEARVSDGDEVALLPPLSGGSGRPWVQPAPLSMDALLAEVSGPSCGGVVTFTGVVRDHARGQTIDHLEYEAYVPMAEKQMRAIAGEAAERWPDVRLAMSHRVGRLEIGDAAVMIAAASPHRNEAFLACRFAIDTLKQTVPIWKKEFAAEGTYWVEENP